MSRVHTWRIVLTTVALLIVWSPAGAQEPPSSKVARWHDQLCPRDLTPIVTGPCFGFYPTRWRIMPPCDAGDNLVLPPVALSPANGGKPAGKSVAGPSPYFVQPVVAPVGVKPKGDWTARPAAAPLVPASQQDSLKPASPRPDSRALDAYRSPVPDQKRP